MGERGNWMTPNIFNNITTVINFFNIFVDDTRKYFPFLKTSKPTGMDKITVKTLIV